MITNKQLLEILEKYLAVFPDERENLAGLRAQLDDGEQMNTRKNFRGHITGSAIVLSPDHTKILLIHHKLFDKWLQPGGHWDPGEPDPWTAARREAIEETNVQLTEQLRAATDDLRVPLHIDTHPIHARPEKNEPAHPHHDFRYVFLAANEELHHQAAEVFGAAWMYFDDPRATHAQRMIAKLRQANLIR